MADLLVPLVLAASGIAAIVWGAETFAEHLARASARLGVSTFALTVLLAGAEPEELATAVAATVRDAPGIAFGDVVGANVTIALVALGTGAVVAPLPFGRRVLRYGVLALPALVAAVLAAWDGHVGRVEGALLVGLYVAYIAIIWIVEHGPPSLGEADEVAEARQAAADAGPGRRRAGRELALVFVGLAAMVLGATLLVDGVRDLLDTEADQVRASLTVVGFATGFELVVLAWSAARRGISDAVVAGVVGSLAYNATMTLGVAALVRPLRVEDATLLHAPMVAMVVAAGGALALARRRGVLGRPEGFALLGAYPAFVGLVLVS